MNLESHLMKFGSWFYARERDPRRAQAIWQEFDERRHYAQYLEYCRAAWRRSPEPPADLDLEQRGVTYLRALQPAAALACTTALESRHQPQLIKKDSRYLEGFRVDDRQWLEGLLGQMLQGQVDAAIAGFFRSEYLVHWVTLALTRPAREQKIVSFRWHCDKGPSAHLKLIVYLNPTASHGGNTEFIDLEDTMAVARRGYLFGWSKARTGDSAHLAHIAGRALTTYQRELDAGESVLFQPARVLHRGVSPTRGPRLTATLCLLPSPVPWRRALQCGTMSDLAQDEKWHDDALEFLAAFSQRLQHDPAEVNR
jgi:hypothetical protein